MITMVDDERGATRPPRRARIAEEPVALERIRPDGSKRLAVVPSEVGEARRYALRVLDRAGVTDESHGSTVELLVSELATNASAPRGALLYPRRSREELEGGFWV